MSSYDRYDSRRRRHLYGPSAGTRKSALGYWVPLILTVTVATAGLAAWVWSERRKGDDDDDGGDLDYEKPPEFPPRPPPGEGGYHDTRYAGPPGPPGPGPYAPTGGPPSAPPPSDYVPPYPGPPQGPRAVGAEEDTTLASRMSGVMRRTPSPQQFFDSAGRQIAAGVAAAGAAVGSALGSITEEKSVQRSRSKGKERAREREEGFSDHERWSEEAISRRKEMAASTKSESGNGHAKKTVAIVLNADTGRDLSHSDTDVAYRTEHASILSHLPQHMDPTATTLFVLIYAPNYSATEFHSPAPKSSYSTMSEPAMTPASETLPDPTSTASEPMPSSSPKKNPYFNSLRQQALALVGKKEMIMPFSTPTGYIHLLRHLSPQLVYMSDSRTLSGERGENIEQLRGWVGQVVLVVGDEVGGGLVDTETEDESAEKKAGKQSEWWQGSEMIGLGKGVEVVDTDRVGDDWVRRLVKTD